MFSTNVIQNCYCWGQRDIVENIACNIFLIKPSTCNWDCQQLFCKEVKKNSGLDLPLPVYSYLSECDLQRRTANRTSGTRTTCDNHFTRHNFNSGLSKVKYPQADLERDSVCNVRRMSDSDARNQWRTQEFFFRGGGFQQIQLRTERTGIWGR